MSPSLPILNPMSDAASSPMVRECATERSTIPSHSHHEHPLRNARSKESIEEQACQNSPDKRCSPDDRNSVCGSLRRDASISK